MPALCIHLPAMSFPSLAILLTAFRAVVIPVQFQDREFVYGENDIKRMLTKAETYLDTQFRGSVSFSFDLAATVTLSHDSSYYGWNGERGHDYLIHEALIQACTNSPDVDFSLYDNNSDGTVDGVILLAAGPSESDGTDPDDIWPSYRFLHDSTVPILVNGKWIDPFITISEIKSSSGKEPALNGPGDLCHELCHIFNLPDFYDTDGMASGGTGAGLWQSTSLMDGGNRNDYGNTPPNFNSIELELLGLGESIPLTPGRYSLKPLDKESKYIKAPTEDPDEYILIECRDARGWDEFIGGSGLLAYHIDKREPEYRRRWEENRINCDPSHQCAELIASSTAAESIKELFLPYKERKSLCLGKYGIDLSLTGISRSDDGTVSFTVIRPLTISGITTFQNAATISWETDSSLGQNIEGTISWTDKDGDKKTVSAGQQRKVTIEGLSPQTKYIFTLECRTQAGEVFEISSSFATKSLIPGIPPYIMLGEAARNEDGTIARGSRIPLRLNNAPQYESIRWFFDNREISPDPTGYYTIRESGTLKAAVRYTDGTTDIIIKELIVR